MKAVHSVNSIKKILDSQGLGGLTVKDANNLMLSHSKLQLFNSILEPPVISILNEKPGITKLPADASNLPFLHEYPVI